MNHDYHQGEKGLERSQKGIHKHLVNPRRKRQNELHICDDAHNSEREEQKGEQVQFIIIIIIIVVV